MNKNRDHNTFTTITTTHLFLAALIAELGPYLLMFFSREENECGFEASIEGNLLVLLHAKVFATKTAYVPWSAWSFLKFGCQSLPRSFLFLCSESFTNIFLTHVSLAHRSASFGARFRNGWIRYCDIARVEICRKRSNPFRSVSNSNFHPPSLSSDESEFVDYRCG